MSKSVECESVAKVLKVASIIDALIESQQAGHGWRREEGQG
jgi:hypothetical protein